LFDVYVHDRLLKTPQGHPIQVPTLALAKAIEEEWEKDPSLHYRQKPLTSLVATALDRVAEDREAYISSIIEAVSSDVLLFWAATPTSLIKSQEEKWRPVITQINRLLGLALQPTPSFSINPLSAEEEEKIRVFLNQQTIFKLTGFAHMLTLTSSFCLSFLVSQDHLSPENGWELAHLHEENQRQTWGEDPEMALQEEAQRKEFLETVRFLKLMV